MANLYLNFARSAATTHKHLMVIGIKEIEPLISTLQPRRRKDDYRKSLYSPTFFITLKTLVPEITQTSLPVHLFKAMMINETGPFYNKLYSYSALDVFRSSINVCNWLVVAQQQSINAFLAKFNQRQKRVAAGKRLDFGVTIGLGAHQCCLTLTHCTAAAAGAWITPDGKKRCSSNFIFPRQATSQTSPTTTDTKKREQ